MRVKTTLHFEINSLLLISLNLNRARNMKNNQTYKSFTWSASKAVNASSPSDVLQDKMQTGHLASLEEGSSVRSFSDNKSLLLIATITLFKAGSSSPLWSSTSLDIDSWSGCMSCAGGDELLFVSRNCPLFMYSVFGELWSKFCKVVAGMPRQTIWSSIYSDHFEWGDLVLMTFVASIINTLRSAFCALKGKCKLHVSCPPHSNLHLSAVVLLHEWSCPSHHSLLSTHNVINSQRQYKVQCISSDDGIDNEDC